MVFDGARARRVDVGRAEPSVGAAPDGALVVVVFRKKKKNLPLFSAGCCCCFDAAR